MRREIILTLISAILLLLPAQGAAERRDSVIVSLLTCWPGPEVYELCGHEAVRVRSASVDPMPGGMKPGESEIDSVWNYGTFDFDQPNFIYRFVKGETDYMVVGYPMRYFLWDYVRQGRRVVEQDLNLTNEEAWRMLEMLRENSKPENRTYRYNYVKDNCATRITALIDSAAGARVVYPDTVKYGTFRNTMRAYHRDYPWYQAGIDVCLGSGIDYPLRGREEMFVPVEMMEKSGAAHMSDGRPLVRETRVLSQGVPDATLGPGNPLLRPLPVSIAVLAIILLICFWMWRRKRIFQWLYTLWFTIIGVTGCLVTFLVFVSSHEATTPNLLLLWLNPLQLVIAAGVWWKSWRPAVTAMSYVDIIVLAILLIVWPMQAQSANPAFFPLEGATLALALMYAIIGSKFGFTNRYEEVSNLGARKSGHAGRGRSNRRGKTPAGGRNRR